MIGMKRREDTILSEAKRSLMSGGTLAVLVAMALAAAGPRVWAQSGQSSSQTTSGQSQKPASQGENPFPGETPQAPAPQPDAGKPAAGQQDQAAPNQAAPKKSSDNPFPGEDSNAPIIPTEPGAADSGTGSGANSGAPGHRDPGGDPVRSPDEQGRDQDSGANDGFTSSLSGVNDVPSPDTLKAPPPVHVENVQEDLNVGKFYLDRKNWRAAQSRFAAAFAADKENPDAVWGLAESERHLGMLKEAGKHYQLFLTYDPGGPHGKEARKALGEVEAQLNSPGMSKK
jgi:tetratricopeptide (TPR) repeat protein